MTAQVEVKLSGMTDFRIHHCPCIFYTHIALSYQTLGSHKSARTQNILSMRYGNGVKISCPHGWNLSPKKKKKCKKSKFPKSTQIIAGSATALSILGTKNMWLLTNSLNVVPGKMFPLWSVLLLSLWLLAKSLVWCLFWTTMNVTGGWYVGSSDAQAWTQKGKNISTRKGRFQDLNKPKKKNGLIP